ncbi:TRAP transporter small permease [Agrobacterium sp. a22-2]|uniref:TRAP transporter small permease n=1 Tax=Agrobacterium sp. a22-2 TaxID=2283840 RepID=UPI00144696F8|nr:TRAP transporter small permease [Agrobacterium sp. a22-2]NKN38180.1 TRAP transporter small permease [Agrobacterium sp. a22-2]
MSVLNSVPARFIRHLANGLAGAGVVLLMGFAVATLLDGSSRSLFNNPIDIVRDLGGMIVGVSLASFIPLAFLERANIEVTFIDGIVPPQVGRLLALFAAFVTLAFMTVFAWQFLQNARNFQAAGEVTPMLGYPRAPFWFVIDGLLWIAVVVQFVVVLELLGDTRRERRPSPLPDHTAD